MYTETILSMAKSALLIWQHKNANKYKEKFDKIERKLFHEKRKIRSDHALIDNYEYELYQLGKNFAHEIERSQTKIVP